MKLFRNIILCTISILLGLFLSFMGFIAYKTAPITHSHVSNPKEMCKQIYKAHMNNDFKEVTGMLKKELDVHERDIHISSEGIQVELDGFFVTSVGLMFYYDSTEANKKNNFFSYTFLEECIGGYMTD